MMKLQIKSRRKALIKALSFLAVALVAIPSICHADINNGLTTAASTISGTYALVSKLCLAVGSIVGLAGGIRVYIKWNGGDHEVQKEVIGWAGAAIFLLLTGTVLNIFFT